MPSGRVRTRLSGSAPFRSLEASARQSSTVWCSESVSAGWSARSRSLIAVDFTGCRRPSTPSPTRGLGRRAPCGHGRLADCGRPSAAVRVRPGHGGPQWRRRHPRRRLPRGARQGDHRARRPVGRGQVHDVAAVQPSRGSELGQVRHRGTDLAHPRPAGAAPAGGHGRSSGRPCSPAACARTSASPVPTAVTRSLRPRSSGPGSTARSSIAPATTSRGARRNGRAWPARCSPIPGVAHGRADVGARLAHDPPARAGRAAGWPTTRCRCLGHPRPATGRRIADRRSCWSAAASADDAAAGRYLSGRRESIDGPALVIERRAWWPPRADAIGWLGLAGSLVLIAVAAGLSLGQRLGLERSILWASTRARCNCSVVGSALRSSSIPTVRARWRGCGSIRHGDGGRRHHPLAGAGDAGAFSLALAAAGATGGLAVLFGLQIFPMEGRTVVPLAGMIVGNAWPPRGGCRRIVGELTDKRAEVEARLALGLPWPEAARPYVRPPCAPRCSPRSSRPRPCGLGRRCRVR